MFAIVEAGGRQDKVAPGAVLVVDQVTAEPGAEITFDKVLLVETGRWSGRGGHAVRRRRVGHGRGRGPDQGQEDSRVQDEAAEALPQGRGHRTLQTRVRVTSINI